MNTFFFREDMYSQDSIDLLANSGLQFQKHEEEGIDTLHFAELLMTSGVVLCDNVKWLSFHRSVSEHLYFSFFGSRGLHSDVIFAVLIAIFFRWLMKQLWNWNGNWPMFQFFKKYFGAHTGLFHTVLGSVIWLSVGTFQVERWRRGDQSTWSSFSLKWTAWNFLGTPKTDSS